MVDTCLSGSEAIEMLKQRARLGEDYDLVFMDHMMPEMDGIETTEAIRAWEKEEYEKQNQNMHNKNGVEFPQETPKQLLERPKVVPIIALTANVVSGMREMFLEKGFSDFLAKPIVFSELDEILDKWISKEKREWGIGSGSVKKKLVLLVDNNLSNLRSGMDALEEKYDVITAPSVEKMLLLLENNSPDIILLGANMQNDYSGKWSDRMVLLKDFDPSSLLSCIENHFSEKEKGVLL
jgi:CheY-like chemotaxis protein